MEAGEIVQHKTADSRANYPRKSHGRSRVSNGHDVLPDVDGRSVIARRYKDIAGAILADQGGADQCSESRQQLIRRFAAAAVLAEQMESRLANGEEINIQEHATLSSTLVRLAQRIGIDRITKDVSELDLSAYLARADSAVTVDALSDADEVETPKTKSRTSGRRKGRASVHTVDIDTNDDGDSA